MWKKIIDKVAMGLVSIGGLNWGLVGLFEYNLVEALFGNNGLVRVIYSLVGFATVWLLYKTFFGKNKD